jgi:hypothetical protein
LPAGHCEKKAATEMVTIQAQTKAANRVELGDFWPVGWTLRQPSHKVSAAIAAQQYPLARVGGKASLAEP